MREKIMPGDDRLYGLGYRESPRKPGLYGKPGPRCRAYLDHRNVGGAPVAEQVERGPLFYVMVPAGGGWKWGTNREVVAEQRRLVGAGIRYRASAAARDAGELEWGPGLCDVCGREIPEGRFCDWICERIDGINGAAGDGGRRRSPAGPLRLRQRIGSDKYNRRRTYLRMQEIIRTIEVIRGRIDKHKTALSGSEAMTRYALIDPMLRALDWDVSDPDTVTPEDAGTAGFKIDYTMGGDMVVEAKKFGERLDRHADQLIEYVRASKVRYGVLTNGQRWRMYDSRETMSAVKVEFDVMDPVGIVLQKSAALHRLAVSGSPSPEPAKPEAEPARDRGVPIEKAKYAKGKAPPVELLCPDATAIPLGSWTDIIVGVAQWLVDRKYLDESHCPVPIGPNNALFNRWPVHQDSSKTFGSYKKVGQFFVNTLGASPNAARYAVKMIDAAGQKPSDFRLRFEDSGKTRASRGAKQRRTKRRRAKA